MKNSKALFAARDIALIGVMSALLSAVKFIMAALPNIEGVSLLLMVFTLTLGWKRSLAAALVFSTVEVFLYGFNTWLLMYYINWPLLVMATLGLQKLLSRFCKNEAPQDTKKKGLLRGWLKDYSLSTVCYAALSGLFGFAFGFFCAIVQAAFFAGSRGYFPYLFAYWVSGLSFDIAHMAGNFVLALVLMPVLLKVFSKIGKVTA